MREWEMHLLSLGAYQRIVEAGSQQQEQDGPQNFGVPPE